MAHQGRLRHLRHPAAGAVRLVDQGGRSSSTSSAWASWRWSPPATWWLVRSPWGRAFTALRENPMRADSLGVDTRRYTLMAFAIGSALGGIAGVLYAPLVQFIEPTRVHPQPVAEPAADGDGRRLGLLPRPVPRRRGLGAAARVAALRQRGPVPHLLRDRGDGADGVLPVGTARARASARGKLVR